MHRLLATAPLLAALLGACTDAGPGPVQPDTVPDPSFTGWRLESEPVLTDDYLSRGWAASREESYVAVGTRLLRHDGTGWSVAAIFPRSIAGLAGVSAREIYVTDYDGVLHRWDGTRWTAQDSGLGAPIFLILSPTPGHLYGTVGEHLAHYDGTRWTRLERLPATSIVGPLWSAGPDDVFMASGLSMFRRQGGAWRRMELSLSGINGLWGSGPDDVFGVGSGGLIIHWDGRSWRTMEFVTDRHLASAWGRGPNDVFAVGEGGVILHYDGTRWRRMESGTRQNLRGVWGAGSAVFAAGEHGTVLRFDGTRWVRLHSAPVLHGVWAASPQVAFAVGEDGTVLRRRGPRWERMESGTFLHLRGVWGRSAREVYAVGDSGVVLRYDGSRWSPMRSGSTASLQDVTGHGNGDLYAVGASGTLLHYSAGAWRAVPTGTTVTLGRVAARETGEVFAGGDGGLLRYDGAAVTPLAPPVDLARTRITALAAPEGGPLYVAARGRASAFLLRREGERWSQSAAPGSLADLHALSPSLLLAVDESRRVVRIDGSALETFPIPEPGGADFYPRPNALWALGGGEVFVVGSAATIFHGRF